MKTYLYFALMGLLTSLQTPQAYSQNMIREQPHTTFKAGSWQVGLKEGYGQGNLAKNRNSLQVNTGYYLISRLLLGINATWSKEWLGDFNFHDLSAGPYVRYHFTATRISPFIDASYQIGRRSAGAGSSITYPSVSLQSTQLAPGLNFGLTNALRIDVSYGLQWTYFPSNSQSFGQAQLGLAYLL